MSEERFLIGSATAGGQVEGNNTNSDTWAQDWRLQRALP